MFLASLPVSHENEKQLKTLAYNLLTLRLEKGITRSELSRMSGVPLEEIESLEKAVPPHCLDAGSLLRLCHYYRVSPEILLSERFVISAKEKKKR